MLLVFYNVGAGGEGAQRDGLTSLFVSFDLLQQSTACIENLDGLVGHKTDDLHLVISDGDRAVLLGRRRSCV